MLRVYAQSATASMPIIGSSWSAPVADCPPLSRPHNLHYVGMPAAQGCLARLPLREFLIVIIVQPATARNEPRSRQPALDAPPRRDGSLWTFEASTVLAVSRADLDTAARGAR
jgi:hypothetical protein